MNAFFYLVDFIIHIDTHLGAIIESYEMWTYAILFLIIFLETGIVLAPFLPGDSLLFAAGTFAGIGILNPILLAVLLALAAILGDTANYRIGYHSSSRIFKKEAKLLNESYLERPRKFYEKHGKKTIIIARFIPIIRTFAPFAAGLGKMNFRQFAEYNILGGILWVTLFVSAGYFFGNIPLVRKNFSLVILGIILTSIIPTIFEFVNRMAAKDK